MITALLLLVCLTPLALAVLSPRHFFIAICLLAGFPMGLLASRSGGFSWAGGLTAQALYMLCLLIGCGIVCTVHAEQSRQGTAIKVGYFAIFLLYAALSLGWTPDLVDGLRMLAKLLAPGLVMLAAYRAAKSVELRDALLTAIEVGALLAVFLAVVNLLTHGAMSPLTEAAGLGSTPALASPTNSPANFCFLVMVAALVRLFRLTRRVSLGGILLLLVFGAAMALAFVRIGLLGAFCGACVVMLLTRRRGFLPLLLWGAVAAIALGVVSSSDAIKQRMFFEGTEFNLAKIAEKPSTAFETINTSGRSALWERALREFSKRSVLAGAGVGSVDHWINSGRAGSELHSEVLRIYIELGVLGLLLWIVAFARLIRALTRRTPEERAAAPSDSPAPLAAGCVVAYCCTLLTDNSINYVSEFSITVFALAGVALAQRSGVRDAVRAAAPTQHALSGLPQPNFLQARA